MMYNTLQISLKSIFGVHQPLPINWDCNGKMLSMSRDSSVIDLYG